MYNVGFGRLLGLVFACSLWIGGSHSPLLAKDWAGELFATKTHDFGVVATGSKTTFLFEMKNKYQQDIQIASVSSSCGCTTPTVTKTVLKTGEKGGVLATFNTTSFTGPKTATITVKFNQPFFAEVQLLVSGNIVTDVFFEPSDIAFGDQPQGAEPERDIKVTFLNRPNLKIDDIRSECTDLKVRVGEPTRNGNSVSYVLKVVLKPTMPPGQISERLTLVTSDKSLKTVLVGISGNIRPPIEVNPDSLYIAIPAGKQASERLLLRSDKMFEIKKVVCEDNRFSFDVPKGIKKLHFIKLKFDGDPNNIGPFQVPVQIETSLEDCEPAKCVITGEVQDPQ